MRARQASSGPTVSGPTVAAAVPVGGGDTFNIHITSSPTITGGGTAASLEDNAREIARLVMEEIEALQSRRGRLAYGGV